MQIRKIYPKPTSLVRERFINFFGCDYVSPNSSLMFSKIGFVALSLIEIDTSREKWHKKLSDYFLWSKYLGKVACNRKKLEGLDFIEHEDLRFDTKDFIDALTILKVDLHDEVDVWLLEGLYVDKCAIGLGSRLGFIVIYSIKELKGRGIKLEVLLDSSVSKTMEININSNIVEKWLRELKIE